MVGELLTKTGLSFYKCLLHQWPDWHDYGSAQTAIAVTEAKAVFPEWFTLHALESIIIAIQKICRGSQKVDHVTQTRIRVWPTVAYFLLGPPATYRHTKFQFCIIRRSGDMKGIPKFRIKSRDSAPAP